MGRVAHPSFAFSTYTNELGAPPLPFAAANRGDRQGWETTKPNHQPSGLSHSLGVRGIGYRQREHGPSGP